MGFKRGDKIIALYNSKHITKGKIYTVKESLFNKISVYEVYEKMEYFDSNRDTSILLSIEHFIHEDDWVSRIKYGI